MLGLRACSLLAAHAARVVLTSRSGRAALDRQAEPSSAVAEAAACDVADAVQVWQLLGLGSAQQRVGVLHAAGVGDKGLISTLAGWRPESHGYGP